MSASLIAIFAIPPLVLGIAALTLFLRRIFLAVSREQSQLAELQNQLAGAQKNLAAMQADLQRVEGAFTDEGNRLRSDIAVSLSEAKTELRNDVSRICTEALLSRFTPFLDRLSQLETAVAELPPHVFRQTDLLSAGMTELKGVSADVRGLVEIVRKVPLDFPVEESLAASRSEPELVNLAQAMTVLRPLVPYPGWRFDADWNNPDLAFRLRQRLWQFFTDHGYESPVVAEWHLETRLWLSLNNDLSRQIFIAGCIDPNEFVFLDRFLRPGMTFLDVGANEGVYSVVAAKRVGPEGSVWAFEPSRRELGRLKRNVESNSLSIRIFPAALSDTTGRIELLVAENRYAGLNTLGTFAYEGVESARTEIVESIRLDDAVEANSPARIDLIKVDVEGAELRVFRGASTTLQRFRPVILFEVLEAALRHQGTDSEELLNYVKSQQYDLYRIDPRTGLPAPATAGRVSENMLAVPSETSLPDTVFRYWPSA